MKPDLDRLLGLTKDAEYDLVKVREDEVRWLVNVAKAAEEALALMAYVDGVSPSVVGDAKRVLREALTNASFDVPEDKHAEQR